MKLKFTRLFIGVCIALCVLVQSSVAAGAIKKEDPKAKKEKKETGKVSSSRNNNSVRIYPDIVKRVMHVVAKDTDEDSPIDFFVFDLEGTIVKHYRMNSGDHEKLVNLERGKYVFRVFAGDEETAMGNFEIR